MFIDAGKMAVYLSLCAMFYIDLISQLSKDQGLGF